MRIVFVSSTSEDLKPFRQAAKDVILDLEWHPVMMEHFGADGSAGIVEACRQRVAGADLVLVILAWRIGWIPGPEFGGDGNRSITQIEIDTAKALGKPVVFLLAQKDWPGHLWENETGPRQKMAAIRSEIDRLAAFFSWEPVEVGVTESLPQFRAKVRQALLKHGPNGSTAPAPETHPTPKYPNDEVRRLSEALDEAHRREEAILIDGGDLASIKAEILDLRRKIREGGNVKAGDVLSGRFKLIEFLGDGGFATVWKAIDRKERKLVAAKVLHPQVARDGSRLDRFFRGARKMAEISHPGIVRVHERRLEDGGYHYFVMEYVEGGDLRTAVLEKRLPPDRILPLIRKVAVALQYFHDQGDGFVHRDIKPANILLTTAGQPKITDFDLVRAATDTTGGTKAGAMLGTYHYTAPECMGSPHEAGARADVYSLAMTAAFCFAGTELPYSVWRQPEAFVDSLPCPLGIRKALRKGIALNPADRFPSVAALYEAIKNGFAPLREFAKPSPEAKRTPAKKSPLTDAYPSDFALLQYLERIVPTLSAQNRANAVLEEIQRSLPLGSHDLKTLGIVMWALDYYLGRSARSKDRNSARNLREIVLAPLRERYPPPPNPGPDDPNWATIPEGTFQMGSPPRKGEDDERPVHRVSISSFRLGIHPVTVSEYEPFRKNRKLGNLPVTGVNWYLAYACAGWLGGRLPTESEWEYAARAGTSRDYSDRQGQPAPLDHVGWFNGNAKNQIQPVGGLEPNPWGLYDMVGNVWEWVADWHSPYTARDQSDPWGPPSGDQRVMRGGSAWDNPNRARTTVRARRSPGLGDVAHGFRIALPVHSDAAEVGIDL